MLKSKEKKRRKLQGKKRRNRKS